VSSTTRLLVLGVVKLFQPVHGYEVRRELLSWRAQEWASVQPGSIYNALKTLTRDGLLEIASTDQVGGRPERTTYRLTQAGAEEFRTLLREEWWTVRPPVDPLMAALSFLGEVPRAEAIAALEHRAAQVHGMIRGLEFAIEGHDGVESPYHVREMLRLMTARVAAELAWSEQFLERLRRGEYITGDEPTWQPPPPPPAPGPRRTTLGPRDPAPAARNGAAPPRRTPQPRSAVEAAGERMRRNGARAAGPRVPPAPRQAAPAPPAAGGSPRTPGAPVRTRARPPRSRGSRRPAPR
jgi:DNA-binding PadR family transcriptional regulator